MGGPSGTNPASHALFPGAASLRALEPSLLPQQKRGQGPERSSADHAQSKRFGLICTFGLGQAGVSPKSCYVLKKQERTMSLYSTRCLKHAECVFCMLCGKLSRDWPGLVLKHPPESEPCPPGEATACPSYQRHAPESIVGGSGILSFRSCVPFPPTFES